MTILYNDARITRMTTAEVSSLGLLCPKKVYYQMETSGSPSAWTDYGERFAGTTGNDIVRCARDIHHMAAECEEYNRVHRCGLDNYRSFRAHIRVIF